MYNDANEMSDSDEDSIPLNQLQRFRQDRSRNKATNVTDFTKHNDIFFNILQHAESSSDSVKHLLSLGLLCKNSRAIVKDMMSAVPDVKPKEGNTKKQTLVPTWLTALRSRAALVTDSQIQKQMSGYDSDHDMNESDDNLLRLRRNKTRMSVVHLLETMYTEEHVVATIFKHLCKNIPNIMTTITEGVSEGIVSRDTDLFSLCIQATRCHVGNTDIFKYGCSIMTALYAYDGWYDKYTAGATSMLVEGFCTHRKNISVVSSVMCQISATYGEYPSVVGNMVGISLQERLNLTAAVCGIMDHCVAQKMHKKPSPGPALRWKRAKLIEAACRVVGMVWTCLQTDYYTSTIFKTSLETFDNVVHYFERPELNDGMIMALEYLLSAVSATRGVTNVYTVELLLKTDLLRHLCTYWKQSMTRGNDMRMLSIVYEVVCTGHDVPDHSSIIRHCLLRGLVISQSSIRVYGFHCSETFIAEALGRLLKDACQRPDEKSQKFVVAQGILTICIAMIGDMTSSRRNVAGQVTNADQKKTRLWLELLSLAVAGKQKYQTRLIAMDGLQLLEKLVSVEKGNETTPLEIAACTLMSCLVVHNFKMIHGSIFSSSISTVARAIAYATSRSSGVTTQQATLCVQTLDFLHKMRNLDYAVTLRSFVTMANLLKTHCSINSDETRTLQKGIVKYLCNVWVDDPHLTKYRKKDFDRCIFVFPHNPLLENDEQYQKHLKAIHDHWS
jgi:hypothetical protein